MSTASLGQAPLRRAIALAALISFGCQSDDRPEPPTIQRDVAMIDDEVRFTHPYVPGLRTSMDGRIALQVENPAQLAFFLFTPEKLTEPVVTGAPGARMVASTDPVLLRFPQVSDPDATYVGHRAICDPPEPRPGEQGNPYLCGPDGRNDCYDLTVVAWLALANNGGVRLYGLPVTVEVAEPKTAAATIVSVTGGTPVRGAEIPTWFEPAVTRDGRLMTGRLGDAFRSWTNPNTGETSTHFHDLAYSVLPDEYEPCDVRGWTDFHPISHAPYDPEMVGTYGLAAYPFRDGEGQIIPDGGDLGGTYPWVDREGTNVFMTGVPGRIVDQSERLYPRRCITPGCDDLGLPFDEDRGYQVAGLWTHGKFVHLDALINNVDWAVGVSPAGHYMVDLYRDAEGQDVPVRFGSGRFDDTLRGSGPYPPGYPSNPNILDSVQNLPNHQARALPVTPRDVVWLMSSGVATDEIAFDDYVDPGAFIVSNMQASITNLYSRRGEPLALPRYHNGQVRRATTPAWSAGYRLFPELAEEIHLQNAATSLSWNVPAYGRIDAGAARIEPVALGGIKGKGLWLDGGDAVRYEVGAQPRSIDDVDWYVGIFLDPRGPADEPRTLARFPDATELRLAGRTLRYVAAGAVLHEVELPVGGAGEGWFHLGLRGTNGNRTVTLLANGFPLDRYEARRRMFAMVPGELVIGNVGDEMSGFEGWIDELKVLAHDVNAEVACNHAHGTLVRVDDHDGWWEIAGRYPGWAHDEVATAAGAAPGAARYACFHDYSRDYAAHLANLPAGTASVRGAINFPEGPLRAGVPRPDSSQNPFCLGCHHANGQGGLSLDALALDPATPAERDPRRQPHQPPARVFGNVPGGWIAPGPGPGSPSESFQAPPEGVLVDPWLLPGAGSRGSASAAAGVHRH